MSHVVDEQSMVTANHPVKERGERRTSARRQTPRISTARRGQALVEFALVALVMYMLLAAILTFGQMLYCSQTLQQASDVAAKELSRIPLPANDTLAQALTDPTGNVQRQIYDEHYLVLTIDAGSDPMTFNGGYPLSAFPLVIQQLAPIMIYDQVGGVPVLRYPGAMFTDPGAVSPSEGAPPYSGYVVRIPVALNGGFTWTTVVEEVNSPTNEAAGISPFQISSSQRGIVALRINYPYQSASMSGFQTSANGEVNPIAAGPAPAGPPGVGAPVTSDFEYGPYAGEDSLGQQAVMGQTVRPYSQVLSAQSIFRREVFQ